MFYTSLPSAKSTSGFSRLLITLLAVLLLTQFSEIRPSARTGGGQDREGGLYGTSIATNPLAGGRTDHTTTLLQNGQVLVAGGRRDNSVLNTAELYETATGTWSATDSPMIAARYGHIAVLLQTGNVLLIGGRNASGTTLNTVEIYKPTRSPSEPRWQTTGSMTMPRYRPTATLLLDGRVLVIGGENASGVLRSAEIYDPQTQTWTTTDGTGQMADRRVGHTATLVNDYEVLVAGGYDGTNHLRSAELYNLQVKRWLRVGDLTANRRFHTSTILPDRKVLIAGGTDGVSFLNTADLYDPTTRSFTRVTATMGTGRQSHTATLLPNGRVLIAGGLGSSGPLNTAQIYNPLTQGWSTAKDPQVQDFSLLSARSSHTATLLHTGRVLIIGGLGAGGAALAGVELFDYAAGTFRQTTDTNGVKTLMKSARIRHTSTLLPNGSVVVIGGSRAGDEVLRSIESYDPVKETWAELPTSNWLKDVRALHTATLLRDGRILVAGGFGADNRSVATVEICNIGGACTQANPMRNRREAHTATLLPDGKVLIAGGVFDNAGSLSTVTEAELFDPSTGGWSSAGTVPGGTRYNHTATLLPGGDGQVILVGGCGPGLTRNSAVIYTPGVGWDQLTGMQRSRYRHTATLLPNNKLLIAGGFSGSCGFNDTANNTAEIYNLSTKQWEPETIGIAARAQHTAAILPNGTVALIGGVARNANGMPSVESVEVYDPLMVGVREVKPSNPMVFQRNRHTMTPLLNGKFLIVGGFEGDGQTTGLLLPGSELFDPGLGYDESWRPAINKVGTPIIPINPPPSSYTPLSGQGWRGFSAASGSGDQSSATDYPLLIAIDPSSGSRRVIDLERRIAGGWSSTSFNAAADFPAPALLSMVVNGIPSQAVFNGVTTLPTVSISGRVTQNNGDPLTSVVQVVLTTSCFGGEVPTTTGTITASPRGEYSFAGLSSDTSCRYEVRPQSTSGWQQITFVPSVRRFRPSGSVGVVGEEICTLCEGRDFNATFDVFISGVIQTASMTSINGLQLTLALPYGDRGRYLTCKNNADCLPETETKNGDKCAIQNPDPGAAKFCACTRKNTVTGDCEETILRRETDQDAINITGRNYTINRVPGGANVLITPKSGDYRFAFNGNYHLGDGIVFTKNLRSDANINITAIPTASQCNASTSISPPPQNVASEGETINVNVTILAGCPWGVTNPLNLDWITINQPVMEVFGSGTVHYTVGRNPSDIPRDGFLVIAGRNYTFRQAGVQPNPVPVISNIDPPTVVAGSGARTVTIRGTGFIALSEARWSGQPRQTIFNSSTELGVVLTATDLAQIGTGFIRVFNPAPGGGLSNQITFNVIANSGGGLQYYALPEPIRLLDTRGSGACVTTGGRLVGGAVRTESARTCGNVPATAVAITGNATVDQPLGNGYITLYPSNAARPTISNLNYGANQTVPNSFTVRLGSDGAFNIYAEASTHFIVDITGYYAPPGAGGMYFYPLPAPVRLLDTRPDPLFSSCFVRNTPLGGGETLVVPSFGNCAGANIPASARALVGNATVVNSQSDGGFITLFPGGVRPNVSNLNFTSGQTVPNAFVVGLSAGGSFSIYAAAATDVIIDIAGYFSNEAVNSNGQQGLLFYPLSAPARWLDTRPNEPACDARKTFLTAGSTFPLSTRSSCEGQMIPINARAVLGNATVVNDISGGGYITLFPSGATQPLASNLNFAPNHIVPNSFVVGLGNDGAFNIFAAASTHFIVDLSGYFAP